jgi:hypothetical protein
MALQFTRLEIDSCKMCIPHVRYHFVVADNITFIQTTHNEENKDGVECMHINKSQQEDTPARINSAPSERRRIRRSIE